MTYPAPGAGDFTPSVTSTPADVLIEQQTAQVIGPSSAAIYGPIRIAGPSYAVAVDALVNVSATIGIFRVVMSWSDWATGLVLGSEWWYVSGTTTNPASNNGLTIGRGPTKADTLTITVRNFDPAQSITLDLGVFQSSRIVTRDDWRGLATGGGYVGFSVPNSECAAGIIGWINAVSIPATGTDNRLCALYAGAVGLTTSLSAVTGVILQVYTPLVDRTAAQQPFLYDAAPPVNGQTLVLPLPRCPVVVSVFNGSGAAINVTWTLAIQEFAS